MKFIADATLAAMSIDFGSQYMKIALVKPGVPMEIVLNKESRRKTPNLIAIRNGERFFGDAALAAVSLSRVCFLSVTFVSFLRPLSTSAFFLKNSLCRYSKYISHITPGLLLFVENYLIAFALNIFVSTKEIS